MSHTTSPITQVSATTAGSLSGHQATCTCGLVLRTSLSADMLRVDIAKHLAWHDKAGK